MKAVRQTRSLDASSIQPLKRRRELATNKHWPSAKGTLGVCRRYPDIADVNGISAQCNANRLAACGVKLIATLMYLLN
jgi:hypothetical protein